MRIVYGPCGRHKIIEGKTLCAFPSTVEPPRLELRMTEPKSAVLPLHHGSIMLIQAGAKIRIKSGNANFSLKFFRSTWVKTSHKIRSVACSAKKTAPKGGAVV